MAYLARVIRRYVSDVSPSPPLDLKLSVAVSLYCVIPALKLILLVARRVFRDACPDIVWRVAYSCLRRDNTPPCPL